MNVLWETMVDELRATRLELDNRRHFTADKKPIELARDLIAEWTEPHTPEDAQIVATQTAMSFRRAAAANMIEVG